MLTVENDWIEYDALPARRAAVRGGSACADAHRHGPRPTSIGVRSAGAVQPVGVVPASAYSVRPAASGRLRLTRRGRVVLVLLPSLLVLSAAVFALSGQEPAQAAGVAAPATVVVGTGDSLWSVAERVAPAADPRDTVAALQRANGLRGDVVAAGMVLVLPAER